MHPIRERACISQLSGRIWFLTGQVVVAAAAPIHGLLVKDFVVARRVEDEADTAAAPVAGGAVAGDRLLLGRRLDLEGGDRNGWRPVVGERRFVYTCGHIRRVAGRMAAGIGKLRMDDLGPGNQ